MSTANKSRYRTESRMVNGHPLQFVNANPSPSRTVQYFERQQVSPVGVFSLKNLAKLSALMRLGATPVEPECPVDGYPCTCEQCLPTWSDSANPIADLPAVPPRLACSSLPKCICSRCQKIPF